AGLPAESTWCQLQRHEHVVGHVVLATEPEARRRLEAEPRIVLRMAKHDNRAEADLRARLKASTHERRADSTALARRQQGHRCQSHDLHFPVIQEYCGRK